MKITCVIIEDEPLAMNRTRAFVEKTASLELLACFDNTEEALIFLNDNKVELLFLDIQLDEMTGIELMESIKLESQVIFTTAYETFALKGFDLNILDYLLKPFNYERFLQAIEKFQKRFADKQEYTFIKTGYNLEKVNFNDVLYIEGMGDYRRIHTTKRKIMTLQTFSELEVLFKSTDLIRVHRSYMVSIGQINHVAQNNIIIGKEKIPVSNTYKKEFQKKLMI